MNGERGSVFISYRREVSWPFAHLLKAHLEHAGFDVFLDVSSLSSGRYEEVTLEEVATRTHFLVILEQGSLEQCQDDTCWIAREVRRAIDSRRNIIPIIGQNFQIDTDLTLRDHAESIVELRGYNAIHFSSVDVDGSLRSLVDRFLSAPDKNNHEKGFIACYKDCISWGWDDVRIEQEVLELAQATMPGMHTSAAIRRGELAALLSEHQDTWRILTTEDHYLLGYWHFVALFEEQFDQAWTGNLLEQNILADALPSIEVPGSYDIYIAGMSLRRSHRTTSSFPKLLSSFTAVARSLAKEDIYLRRICATAITPAGESLCRTLGLKLLTPHCEHGSVYGATFSELVRTSTYLRSQALHVYSS